MNKSIFGPLSAIVIIILLVVLSVTNFFTSSELLTGRLIANDVKKLQEIFNRIHATCHIVGFDNQKNSINFLNVGSFVSSEVGSMNLAYPDKWEGPYVADNFELQGKEYMIVQTNAGYFITPGEGVKLPNGKTIGTDIKLDLDTDIMALMHDKEGLYYKGLPLAAQMVDITADISPQLARLE